MSLNSFNFSILFSAEAMRRALCDNKAVNPGLSSEKSPLLIAHAFDIFLDEADSAIDESVPFYYIPLSIVIGFVLAFVIVKIQASSLKTVRKKADAADYVGNVTLTYQMDNFMYKDVKSTPKSNNNSSSGGTSKYTSSSGDTYGGGSRKF